MCVCVCVRARVCVHACAQLCLTLCHSVDYSPPGSSVHGILQVRLLEWVAFPPLGDLPDPGIERMSPVSPALQADALPAELCIWHLFWNFISGTILET